MKDSLSKQSLAAGQDDLTNDGEDQVESFDSYEVTLEDYQNHAEYSCLQAPSCSVQSPEVRGIFGGVYDWVDDQCYHRNPIPFLSGINSHLARYPNSTCAIMHVFMLF